MGRYALLVGISNYTKDLNPLPSAVKDVAALKDVLIDPNIGGFVANDVEVLTDVDETAIRRGISRLFSNRKNDDLVLLYFSGHGVTDSRNDFYLSGISTDKNDLLPTAVSSDYVQKAMNQRGSKHQVLILDCCHSGAFPKGMTAKDIGKVNLSPKLGGEGRAILTASDSTQYAFEQDGFELSLYTHFLIEGLRTGAADRDNDGNVTIDELYEYVRDKVKSVNDLMSPEFYPVKEGHRIILARAVQDDPALKFRKEISEIIDLRKGKIFPSTRQLIVNAQIKHRVNHKVALEIEKELLKPYLEYENNLNAYKKMLRDMSAHEFPFSEVTQLEIEKCEIDFGLRREDIEKSKRDVESVENKCEETINLKPVESKLFDSKKIKVVVAIQLNASQAGYAYAFTNDKRIMLRTYWDKQPFNRFFTLPHLLYTPDGKIEAWGYAASSRLAELRQLKSTKGYSFFSSFMLLVQESRSHNLDGKPLVIGSDGRKFAVIDLIADYLTQLKNLILGDIGNSTILPLHTNEVIWCLTVPAIWNATEKSFMREAAIKAGLINDDDDKDRERLLLISEPKASIIYCQTKTRSQLGVGKRFMVVDCGNGAVNITVHEMSKHGGLEEVVEGTGGAYGSIYVDAQFKYFFASKITNAALARYEEEDPIGYLEILANWERKKCDFDPDRTGVTYFDIPFRLYRILSKDYPEVLEKLAITQNEDDENVHISREMMIRIFTPVLDGLVNKVKEQFARLDRCDTMYLVGEFSASPMLRQRIQEEFRDRIEIVMPYLPSASSVEGAVSFALTLL